MVIQLTHGAKINRYLKFTIMKTNKYTYLKVIQQNYGQGWEDVSEYETNSQGTPKEYTGKPKRLNNGMFKAVSLLSHDLKEYELLGYPTRVVKRKELTKYA